MKRHQSRGSPIGRPALLEPGPIVEFWFVWGPRALQWWPASPFGPLLRLAHPISELQSISFDTKFIWSTGGLVRPSGSKVRDEMLETCRFVGSYNQIPLLPALWGFGGIVNYPSGAPSDSESLGGILRRHRDITCLSQCFKDSWWRVPKSRNRTLVQKYNSEISRTKLESKCSLGFGLLLDDFIVLAQLHPATHEKPTRATLVFPKLFFCLSG